MVILSAQKVDFSVVEVGSGQGGSGWCREPWLYRAAPTGLRGRIAAGETGFGRIAAGKRQIDQNMAQREKAKSNIKAIQTKGRA